MNPLAVNLKVSVDAIEEERITEVIERLIEKKPNIVAEATSPDDVIGDIQQVIIELGYRNVPLHAVLNNMFGYGILQDYVDDEEVTDIFVNSCDYVAVMKKGRIQKVPVTFKSERKLREFIKRVVIMNGGRINENDAKVVVSDARRYLRIVATLDNIALGTPMLHIRKPPTHKNLDNLIEDGMITEEQAGFLRELVRTRKSLVISGTPGAGKTTLMSALIKEIPVEERVKVIQESVEIRKPETHPNMIFENIRPALTTGMKHYGLFELTKLGLLESLHRIIIGEIKGEEAYEWVFAIYSGMYGSMTTIHAHSADEAINKLVVLMKLSKTDLPHDFLKHILYASLDYILFVEKFRLKEIVPISNIRIQNESKPAQFVQKGEI